MKGFLNNWTAVTGLLALAVAILVWFGFPILLPAMAAVPIRAALAGIVLGAWAAIAFLRRMKAKKANDTIANQLATASGAAEDAVVQKRMAEAISQFKAASGGQRDYLYSRPWYARHPADEHANPGSPGLRAQCSHGGTGSGNRGSDGGTY